MSDHLPNEETPLLPKGERAPRKATPLPKFQIAIVLLLQLCEPITSLSIYPYINQLISEFNITGGDERKVGYYAGLIASLFFVAEAMTVLQWSRVSDHIGRKPVLLIGLFGTIFSMLSFGLSRSLSTLVVSRCLTGLLNGNIGVIKSVMGELTDSTNRAEGFSLIPVVWGFGATMGPLLGGSLSRPHERFPKFFGGAFWKDYPYFLPCLITSSYVAFSFVFALLYFKETLPKRQKYQKEAIHDEEKPLPLRKLLVYPVILSVSNYIVLAFLFTAVSALFPLFLATPLEIGGLDLDPAEIGYITGLTGLAGAIFQVLYFVPLVRYFGERKVFIMAISTFLPIFLFLPVVNMAAVILGKQSLVVSSIIFVVLACQAFSNLAFSTIFVYVTASAPNKWSLGATNGLSQTTASIAKAIGLALSTSLFSFCVQRNILRGYGVYAFFAVISICALYLATRLPLRVWDEADDGSQSMSSGH